MISNFDYSPLLPTDFDNSSKVWIYQSSRLFGIGEALQIEEILETFVAHWKSHGTPVKGYANLIFGQFLIFIADETATGVSGCSTDSSVHVVKEIEALYKVNMFDRQNLAFVVKDKIQTIPLNQFNYALENNFINSETLYFNNTILTLQDLKEKWMLPIKDSWLNSQAAKSRF
jgi:hypothetical protein